MTRPRIRHWHFRWLWLWTVLIAAPGAAQTISERDAGSEDTLALTLAPYAWIQDFSGSVEDTRPAPSSDASTPFAVGALAGGGAIEIRFGATAARFDVMFSQTRSEPALQQPGGLAAPVGTFSRALSWIPSSAIASSNGSEAPSSCTSASESPIWAASRLSQRRVTSRYTNPRRGAAESSARG